jgi:hypothetical protein
MPDSELRGVILEALYNQRRKDLVSLDQELGGLPVPHGATESILRQLVKKGLPLIGGPKTDPPPLPPPRILRVPSPGAMTHELGDVRSSTAGYVKLLLPPRQRRGNSHWGLGQCREFETATVLLTNAPSATATAQAVDLAG